MSQFRLEQQSDLNGFLPTGDPERLPGVGLGIEVGGAGERVSGGLDAPEPRQCERRDLLLGHVPSQDIPVAVVGEQMVGMQIVPAVTARERLVVSPDRLPPLDEVRQLRPDLGIDPHPVLWQDADMFAEPVRFDGDVALQRLGNLVQDRACPSAGVSPRSGQAACGRVRS